MVHHIEFRINVYDKGVEFVNYNDGFFIINIKMKMICFSSIKAITE